MSHISSQIQPSNFMFEHYGSLITSYALATIVWYVLYSYTSFGRFWKDDANPEMQKPSLELLYATFAIIGIIGVGQLYVNNLLIPNSGNYKLIDALNQALIFSPVFILLLIRKQSTETIWLSKRNVGIRIVIGFGISLIALLVYHLERNNTAPIGEMLGNVYQPRNISHLVQVFMEDCAIALLFFRLSAWVGQKWSIAIVAFLFAAAHIPSLISTGASIQEFQNLFLDTLIGTIVFTALSKSKDIAWFFPLHFALDMTQYYGGQ
ncbi:hypothetical protein [Fulvivirga lutea]|uniref:Uncharacterized protein n=1 Tax=Fulvivirga lutea TaxID=2810512 RepID=A0A974WI30_9BACT|nr:hypothetical protein [Fulvivirga lutea]QSE98969.1 hypothetical protein JR347_07760 [Fulvivirga lutea]